MLSLYRTLSLGYLSRRSLRALLIVASIALGVATLVATRALNETMARGLSASTNPMAGIVDLVVSNGELSIARALATEIASVPGVQSADAKLFGQAKLIDEQTKRNILILGIDIGTALKEFGSQSDYVTLSEGTEAGFGIARLLGQTPAVVGKELERDLPAGATRLTVEKSAKLHTLTKVGSVQARAELAVLGGYVIILEQDAAADVLGMARGQVNRIDVLLAQNADRSAVRGAVEDIVAGRAQVQTPFEQNQATTSATAGLRTGFALCGVAALVVGMFLVYSALAVSVAERRHEIGILLALGATRGQVLGLFVGESALLGLAGGVVGVPLGVGLAYLGLQPMRSILSDLFGNVHASQVDVPLWLVGVAILAGILSATFASLVPAVQASRENPAEAVRRVPKARAPRHLAMQLGACVTLVLIGTLLVAVRAALPPRWGTLGGLSVVLIGALASAPLIASLGARLLQPLARRFFPIEWRLAADNLVRAPGRTGLVIGALAAGVGLVLQTDGVIFSNRIAMRQWIDDAFSFDLVVTAGSPLGSGSQVVPMDASVAAELMRLPEIEAIVANRMAKAPFHDVQIALLAVEAGDAVRAQAKRGTGGSELAMLRRLDAERDAVLVSENFAILHGVGPGATITLPSRSGPVKLRVVGQVVDYTWGLGTVVLNRRDYLEHWQDARVDSFDIYLCAGADARQVKEAIAARYGARYDLQPITRAELIEVIDRMVERIYGIAYSQLIVVMLVATLGVVTALLISVLQRRREMGLLRAIGAPQQQVIHAVLAEACLMGVFGTVMGILVGIPLEWYVLRVAILEETGFSFAVHVPWSAVLVISVIATATATLAGIGPALYAVRQRIPEAIAYE